MLCRVDGRGRLTSHNDRRYAMSARFVRKAAARQSRRVHPADSPELFHRSHGDLRCGMLPASVGEDRPFGFHGARVFSIVARSSSSCRRVDESCFRRRAFGYGE
jgi:hypothetical protein